MSKHILIVEDEAITALHVQAILHSIGYSSSSLVDSGEEALFYIDRFNPDLILMDIELSGSMSGIETVRQVKKAYDIPVIYLTGHSSAAILDEVWMTGPSYVLTKPIQSEKLARGIRNILETSCRGKHAGREDTHDRGRQTA